MANAHSRARQCSYTPVEEWKLRLDGWNSGHTPRGSSLRLLEMIEGWITYLEPREGSMPENRRMECDNHLSRLFSRLTVYSSSSLLTAPQQQP